MCKLETKFKSKVDKSKRYKVPKVKNEKTTSNEKKEESRTPTKNEGISIKSKKENTSTKEEKRHSK